jgi:septal ring factor EnvC (AmiA/AmiB activator)
VTRLAFCLLAVLCIGASPCAASTRSETARLLAIAEQQRQAQAREAARAAREAESARAQAAQLAEQRVRAATALRGVEENVVAAAARLAQLQAQQDKAEADLKALQASFSALVPLMLRMSRYPAETVLAVPAPPDQALEGLLLTRGLAAALNAQAAQLRQAMAKLAALKADSAHQQAVLSQEQAEQAGKAAALDRDIAGAHQKISGADEEAQKAAAELASLGARADNLRAAIAAMDAAQAQEVARAAHEAALAQRQKHKGAAQAALAREAALARPPSGLPVGRFVAPVAGPVLRGFGAPAEDGPATGITYGVAPGAYVSSPCAGRVAFAAPFRSYGQLIILECGGGFDVVLAGLGHIGASPGHAVRAGEPIGRMPDFNPVRVQNGAGRPVLYVELRARGAPVDPAPFLNAKG